MAVGLVVGSAIGTATARVLKFDEAEMSAGIYGFNSALVGIATLFFFQPGAVSIALLIVGCVVAAVVTRLMRRYVPFPTYTTPFIVTTWVLFFLGKAMGGSRGRGLPGAAAEPAAPLRVEATAHGVGQVMFQASLWTGLLFLIGIAISDRRHAAWVLVGSIVGMLVAGITPRRPRRPSTRRGSSIAACSTTLRWGSTATTRRWRPSPCICGGGR